MKKKVNPDNGQSNGNKGKGTLRQEVKGLETSRDHVPCGPGPSREKPEDCSSDLKSRIEFGIRTCTCSDVSIKPTFLEVQINGKSRKLKDGDQIALDSRGFRVLAVVKKDSAGKVEADESYVVLKSTGTQEKPVILKQGETKTVGGMEVTVEKIESGYIPSLDLPLTEPKQE